MLRRLRQEGGKVKASLGRTVRNHLETPKSKQAKMQSRISHDRDTRRTGWLGDFPDGFDGPSATWDHSQTQGPPLLAKASRVHGYAVLHVTTNTALIR